MSTYTKAPAAALSEAPPLHPLEEKLVQRLSSGHTALPVLPHVATVALRLASDPDANLVDLAKLVDGDPPIAARFLSVANSFAYRGGTAASTTKSAIMRLGFAATRDLLFQVVYAGATQGLKRFQPEVQRSFSRSVTCGVVCRNLCRELGVYYQYDYMCGLLHDIGQARIYRVLESLPSEGTELVADLVHRYHTSAGVDVARAWTLPGDIVDVCAAHHDPAAQELFHVRLTMLAELVVDKLDAEGKDATGPAVEHFERLGLDEEKLTRVLERTRVARPT
jgi:putative nucleotidyltransferase with HDIG domain